MLRSLTKKSLIIAAAAVVAVAALRGASPKALERLNAIADDVELAKVPDNAPRIGVTTNSNTNLSSKISRSYYDAVVRAGGVPVVIPTTTDRNLLSAIVDVDFLFFIGVLRLVATARRKAGNSQAGHGHQ